jgi:hypothetical protein
MDKATKILFGGILCGGIIASGQMFYKRSLENKLNQIKAECIAEDIAQRKKTPDLDFRMLCDAEDLDANWDGVKGRQEVQSKLVDAYRDLRQAESFPLFLVAALVIGFSALPWLWFFLLRRIRELRDAIVGK